MSSYQYQNNESESVLSSTLPNNDPLMDDLLAQWTTEAEPDMFDSETQAIGGDSNTDSWNVSGNGFDFTVTEDSQVQDSLFLTPYSSPQDATPAQESASEQPYVPPYQQDPSLTAGSWVPDSMPLAGQYPGSTFNDPFDNIHVPIDPALQPFDPFGYSGSNSTLPIPYFEGSSSAFALAQAPPSVSPSWASSLHSEYTPSRSPSPQPVLKKRGVARTAKQLRSTPYSKPTPSKTPAMLTAPLSILTSSSPAPRQRALDKIHRGILSRMNQVERCRGNKNNPVPRPLNSFMLYKIAYKPDIQTIARVNGNQQTVCAVAGESWRMETDEVRAEFAMLAEMERAEHMVAFPDYKYHPQKTNYV